MTSNFPINSENQSFKDSEPIESNFIGKNSRSAVPIFVYQQLVENLHNTQEQLEQIKQINQELVTQNQQLRQEIIYILQAAEQVQQNVIKLNIPQVSPVNKTPTPSNFNVPSSVKETPLSPPVEPESNLNSNLKEEEIMPIATPSSSEIKPASSSALKVRKKRAKPPVKKEKLQFEEHEDESDANNPNSLNGWLLFLAILLIVLTAFGAGFIVMRPLLNPNTNPSPNNTNVTP